MAIEDILGTINDATERDQLRGLLDKYAPVKSALETGDRVGPIFDRVRQMNLDPQREIGMLPDWLTWRTQNTDPETGRIKAVIGLESERDTLLEQVRRLETERGTEMTNDEVKVLADQIVNDKIKALREDPTNPLVDRQTLLGGMNAQAQRFQELYSVLTPQATEHVKKYGEVIPIAEVLGYIEKTGERDPLKAYQAVCAPRDTALRIAALERERDQKFEEGKQKGIEEAQSRINGQRLPVDGGGGQGRGGSHFMRKIFGSREKRADAGNTRLGSGAATQAGLADHQRKLAGAGSV